MIKTIQVRGELRYQEPMCKHTTWRIGGAAERFFIPADGADLQQFLATIDADEPLFWLGLGSNLLVRDGGIAGTVILTSGLNRLENLGGGRWRIEAGVPCAKIARQTVKAYQMGAEFLAGIPGSWGGALAMNAGAFGGETWDLVSQVTSIDRQGRLHQRPPSDFQVSYRHVIAPHNEYFFTAEVQLDIGDAQQIDLGKQRIQALLQQRRDTQPTSQPSCGSVFRNPKPLFAAQLIEASGLKGKTLGGAQVSEKHANFIINTGHARSCDVENLIALVMETVEKNYAVKLHPEVRVIGKAL